MDGVGGTGLVASGVIAMMGFSDGVTTCGDESEGAVALVVVREFLRGGRVCAPFWASLVVLSAKANIRGGFR